MARASALLALVLAVSVPLVRAPSASSLRRPAIKARALSGLELGMSTAQARRLLQRPVQLDRLEGGWRRLVSQSAQLAVYFRTGATGVVAVTTWNRRFESARHVGPCSTVLSLRAAYGLRLMAVRVFGRVAAYRLGELLFTTTDTGRIGTVALARGRAATFVVLNETECGP